MIQMDLFELKKEKIAPIKICLHDKELEDINEDLGELDASPFIQKHKGQA
jgi:hypothetical protein